MPLAYRDDLEAAQARIAALERENAELKQESTALVKAGGTGLAKVGPQNTQRRWLGGPTKLANEKVIDGEVPEAAFALVVDHARDFFGRPGELSVLPGSVTWNTRTTDSRTIELRLTVRSGATTLRLSENLSGWAGGVYGVLGSMGGVAAIVTIASLGPLGVAIVGAGGGGLLVGARSLFRGIGTKHDGQLQTLVDELVTLIENEIHRAESKNPTDEVSPESS